MKKIFVIVISLVFFIGIGHSRNLIHHNQIEFLPEEICAEIPCELHLEQDNPFLVRALWYLARSVFTGWVTNATYDYYIKPYLSRNIKSYAREMENTRGYSSKVQNAYEHLYDQWDGYYTGDSSRKHLSVCSICKGAFNDIARGSGYSY